MSETPSEIPPNGTPPPMQPPVMPPPGVAPGAPPAGVLDTLIPTSNADALVAYYTGLFSILPLFGLFMGPFAIVKARSAFAKIREIPGLPGKTHASVGIGCGSIGLLFNLLIVAFAIALLVSR